jgi:dUTPase
MKLGFGKLNKQAMLPQGSANALSVLTPVPLVLQSGERIDLKTGLVAQIPEEYVLVIQTSPSLLVHKGLEILGPVLIFPDNKEEIKIPLYNAGRSQIDLQPGMEVATALLFQPEPVQVEEFTPQKEKPGRPTSKSPKGDPFKFKVS